jgi:hypothetical protein
MMTVGVIERLSKSAFQRGCLKKGGTANNRQTIMSTTKQFKACSLYLGRFLLCNAPNHVTVVKFTFQALPFVLAQVVSPSLKQNLITKNNHTFLLRRVMLLFGSLYFDPLIK